MKIEDKFNPYVANDYLDAETNKIHCAEIANKHAVSFATWINNNQIVLTWNKSFAELLEYFNSEYNQ